MKNIVLIGMRASGKSSLSRHLAILSKRSVFSTDDLISYDNGGLSIPEIFESNNSTWHNFRNIEYAVVKKMTQFNGIIIDCGGGVVVDFDDQGREIFSTRKISALKQNGIIIWLKGDIPRLAHKVTVDHTRPPLSNILSTEEVMCLREPFYAKAADHIINIEKHKLDKIAQEIWCDFM